MAFPLAAAVPAGLAKLKGALAALKLGKTAVAATNAAKFKAGVAGATRQLSLDLAEGGAKRMAGEALKSGVQENIKRAGIKEMRDKVKNAGLNMADDAGLLDKIKRGVMSPEGFMKNMGAPMTRDDMLMTVAPDLLFGGMAAIQTEGDLVDKALAGAGSAVGGIGGGLTARGLLGPKSGLGILGTEMVGGIIGDQVGYNTANALIRAKHGGMTPQEQAYAQQDEAYQQAIIDNFLAQNGLG